MDAPHIVVTDGTGSVSLLLRRGSPVSVAPTSGLTQVVTAGDTAQRTDQRTPQVIWTDQRGGMGEFAYTETQGLTSFTDSDCNTRFPDLVVLPPAATQLDDAAGLKDATPAFVEYVGATDCYVLAWVQTQTGSGSARRYDDTGSTWNAVQVGGVDISNLTGYAEFRGYYLFATANASAGLYTSTDGVTWAASAKAKGCAGLCTHDNKVWTFNQSDNTLDYATDPTAAHASWGTSTVLYLYPGERVNQVAEWRDRVGRAAVFLVTTRRLIWYDEDADAFLDFADLRASLASPYAYPRLAVSAANGSAYLTLFDWQTTANTSDTVLQYSGVTAALSPALRGGLPLNNRLNFTGAVTGLRWAYFFGYPRDTTLGFGRVLALDEQGGFSTVFSPGWQQRGGGYARGKLFAATHDGTTARIYEIAAPDSAESPLYAARTYRTDTSFSHEYAFTDGGTPNMSKQALWVTVNCLDHTSANKVPGLAATCSVVVQYRTDADTGWTTLGTLTSADTFPKTLAIANGAGVAFKQIKLRLTLASTTAANTPVVVSTALGYIRQEEPKFSYTVVADLSERDHPLYRGQDIAQLRARIASWAQPGSIVRLDYAGGDWGTTATSDNPARATSVPSCTVQFSATEDPEKGPQYVTLVFTDVSAPA